MDQTRPDMNVQIGQIAKALPQTTGQMDSFIVKLDEIIEGAGHAVDRARMIGDKHLGSEPENETAGMPIGGGAGTTGEVHVRIDRLGNQIQQIHSMLTRLEML